MAQELLGEGLGLQAAIPSRSLVEALRTEKMTPRPSQTVRLGDPNAPFVFKKGDHVAWVRFDGSADLEFAGQIVDGFCEYLPAAGISTTVYIVKRTDGYLFGADERHLVRLPPGE